MEQSQVTDEEIRNVRNTVVGKDYVKIWSKMLYYICTELLYLREANRMALRAAPEHDTPAGAEALLREARSWLETLMRQRHDVRPNEPVDTTDDLIARIDAFLRGGSGG